MHSAIYKGSISHKRRGKSANRFRYSLFMMLLDLDELDTVFDDYWFWSTKGAALARLRRSDHYGDPSRPLKDCVRDLVAAKTGQRPAGRIELLTHLSYFGHCFNPLSVYYCYDEHDDLHDVVLEVSNTPWGDQHCYVLGHNDNLSRQHHRYAFNKDFHVSPFMPLDMEYACRLTPPSDRLYIALDNYREGDKVFGSHLTLDRKPLTHKNMALTLARDPLMTLRVVGLIHWQALKLWLKRAPYYSYTRKSEKEGLIHNG